MKKSVLRRVMSTAVIVAMSFSLLAGCGKKDNNTVDDNEIPENYPLNLTSVEAVNIMGNGINLGNTMEAYGRDAYGTGAKVSEYETVWGQPITTKEMIKGYAAAGFDTLRIPVAWTNMMPYENDEYTIAMEYLDRVAEIATWAIDEGMFVIINDHWDGGWWGMFGSATETTRDKAMDMYISMWTQIANRFKDFNGYLIFESANEELGDGLNENNKCPDSGTLSEDECYETTNRINQTFVDTVRATGGINAERFLLIAGYNTNIAATIDSRFVMPTDTVENKLMLSVHYYDPWNYCGTEEQNEWGIKGEYNELIRSISSLSKFIDEGYGVVIGEYGALHTSDGEMKNNTYEYTSAILDLCTKYDICPVLWDTNSFYSKKDCKILDIALANIFIARSYEKEIGKDRAELKLAADERVMEAIALAASGR